MFLSTKLHNGFICSRPLYQIERPTLPGFATHLFPPKAENSDASSGKLYNPRSPPANLFPPRLQQIDSPPRRSLAHFTTTSICSVWNFSSVYISHHDLRQFITAGNAPSSFQSPQRTDCSFTIVSLQALTWFDFSCRLVSPGSWELDILLQPADHSATDGPQVSYSFSRCPILICSFGILWWFFCMRMLRKWSFLL